MRKPLLMALAAAAFASTSLFANSPEGDSTNFKKYEDQLQVLVQRVLRDTSRAMRDTSHKMMQSTFEALLKEEGSFDQKLDIEGVSVVQPEDGAFRIFTWQLYQDKDNYLYGGYLQLKNGTFFRLDDKSIDSPQPQFDRLSHKNWYGALYYAVQHFKNVEGKDMYVLFGYDAYSFFSRRKIADVFYMENDRPRFGSQVFEVKDGFGRLRNVYRVVLEYSATVTVGLKYSPEKGMIVYDHLVAGTPIPDGGPSAIPDGSYEGLRLENGIWKYVEEVFTENPYYGNDNPPMEEKPLFDSNKKQQDLFGKTNRKQYRWMTGKDK